jgi:hypothetical protein
MRCCRARLSVVGVTGARFGWVGNPFKTVGVTLYFYLFIAVYYEWCCVNCWSPFGHLFIILPSFLGLRVARLSRTQISRRHQSSFSSLFWALLFCLLGSRSATCAARRLGLVCSEQSQGSLFVCKCNFSAILLTFMFTSAFGIREPPYNNRQSKIGQTRIHPSGKSAGAARYFFFKK